MRLGGPMKKETIELDSNDIHEYDDSYPMAQIDEDREYKYTSKFAMVTLSFAILLLLLGIFVWVFTKTDYMPS